METHKCLSIAYHLKGDLEYYTLEDHAQFGLLGRQQDKGVPLDVQEENLHAWISTVNKNWSEKSQWHRVSGMQRANILVQEGT